VADREATRTPTWLARLRPASAPPQPWVTLALFVAFVLLAVPGGPPRAIHLHQFLVGGLLFASFGWPVGRLAILALLVAGVDLRLAYQATGSDVLIVTRAAIDTVLAGGNPYGIGYDVSVPPGAPFPYGPLALLWYMPPFPAQTIELVVAMAIVAVLAVRGRPLGLAVYACAPAIIPVASDGANDTSLGLLLLIAFVVAERSPRAGAFGLGLAIAFKPTAVAWLPPMLAWTGVGGALALAAGAGLFWLPAAVAWGPAAILDSIRRANEIHSSTYYSLAHTLGRFGIAASSATWDVVRAIVAASIAAASLFHARSVHAVIGWGAAIFLAGLFGGFWSTFAYFAAVAPIVCWHIDGWLGSIGLESATQRRTT
jgi:hypothetical protein